MADAMAFALWQFGAAKFQPTAGPAAVAAPARSAGPAMARLRDPLSQDSVNV